MYYTFKVRCSAFVEIGTQIWFTSSSFNALICVDKINGKIITIRKIPDNNMLVKDLYSCNLYSCIFNVDNELIIIPDHSDRIITYNIDQNSFFSISISNNIKVSRISNYRSAYLYKESIIMLPNRADKIIIYNYLKKEVLTIDIRNDSLDKLYPDREIQFRCQYEIWDKYLIIPFVECGAILIVDLITKQIDIRLVDGLTGCDTINYYKNTFYLASWNEKKIYALDTSFRIINEYSDFPDELVSDKHFFAYSLLMGEKILYYPQLSNMIISFDLKDKTIREEMRINSPCVDYTKTYIAKTYNDKVISLMAEDKWLSTFYFSGDRLYKSSYCAWDENYNNKVIIKYLIKNDYFNIAYENNISGLDLHALIDILENSEGSGFYNNQSSQTNLVGRQVYKYILKEK